MTLTSEQQLELLPVAAARKQRSAESETAQSGREGRAGEQSGAEQEPPSLDSPEEPPEQENEELDAHPSVLEICAALRQAAYTGDVQDADALGQILAEQSEEASEGDSIAIMISDAIARWELTEEMVYPRTVLREAVKRAEGREVSASLHELVVLAWLYLGMIGEFNEDWEAAAYAARQRCVLTAGSAPSPMSTHAHSDLARYLTQTGENWEAVCSYLHAVAEARLLAEKGLQVLDDEQLAELLIRVAECLRELGEEQEDSLFLRWSEEVQEEAHRLGSAFQERSLTEREPVLQETMGGLDALVGLDAIKDQTRTLVNLLRVQQQRARLGKRTVQTVRHMLFIGPSGTGKTTVARMMGDIFWALGRLERRAVMEVSRGDLVGEHIGETAHRVQQVVGQALGGILFIDEAYQLFAGEEGGRDFGHEALATLLKLMEDHRDRLVVIMAGYPEKMERMLDSNPGLRSRFTTRIDFQPYAAEQLREIFLRLAREHDYRLTTAAEKKLLAVCEQMRAQAGPNFGNARSIRNLWESTVACHANRLSGIPRIPSERELCTIRPQDLHVPPPDQHKHPVGFRS